MHLIVCYFVHYKLSPYLSNRSGRCEFSVEMWHPTLIVNNKDMAGLRTVRGLLYLRELRHPDLRTPRRQENNTCVVVAAALSDNTATMLLPSAAERAQHNIHPSSSSSFRKEGSWRACVSSAPSLPLRHHSYALSGGRHQWGLPRAGAAGAGRGYNFLLVSLLLPPSASARTKMGGLLHS